MVLEVLYPGIIYVQMRMLLHRIPVHHVQLLEHVLIMVLLEQRVIFHVLVHLILLQELVLYQQQYVNPEL